MDNILVNLALRPRNRYARPIIGANLAPTEILKDLYENFGCVIIGRDKKTNALAQYRQVKDALLQGDIWVASTRGRNKDGIISADSKILEYYSAFDVPFAPISISYEIEPTIGTFLRTGGKKRLTDSLHAHTGLMGTKGRTIVSFGPECDASQVQSEIRKNYVVQESHIQGAKYFVNGEAPTNAMILKQMDKGFPREAFKFYDGIVTSTSDFYGK